LIEEDVEYNMHDVFDWLAIVLLGGSVQSFSHIWFGLSGARQWLKR
jgi:hypothetical protein